MQVNVHIYYVKSLCRVHVSKCAHLLCKITVNKSHLLCKITMQSTVEMVPAEAPQRFSSSGRGLPEILKRQRTNLLYSTRDLTE
jgi:hypothetical protein